MSEQIIVFGIFFDERAKKEYGSMINLVRHTFKTHFDDYHDPKKYRGPESDAGEFGGPGRAGKQVIAKDPDVSLYWRNYHPDSIEAEMGADTPDKEELFLNVAFDRFVNDNWNLYKDTNMEILNLFKAHMIEMIKERDEREGKVRGNTKKSGPFKRPLPSNP